MYAYILLSMYTKNNIHLDYQATYVAIDRKQQYPNLRVGYLAI